MANLITFHGSFPAEFLEKSSKWARKTSRMFSIEPSHCFKCSIKEETKQINYSFGDQAECSGPANETRKVKRGEDCSQPRYLNCKVLE